MLRPGLQCLLWAGSDTGDLIRPGEICRRRPRRTECADRIRPMTPRDVVPVLALLLASCGGDAGESESSGAADSPAPRPGRLAPRAHQAEPRAQRNFSAQRVPRGPKYDALAAAVDPAHPPILAERADRAERRAGSGVPPRRPRFRHRPASLQGALTPDAVVAMADKNSAERRPRAPSRSHQPGSAAAGPRRSRPCHRAKTRWRWPGARGSPPGRTRDGSRRPARRRSARASRLIDLDDRRVADHEAAADPTHQVHRHDQPPGSAARTSRGPRAAGGDALDDVLGLGALEAAGDRSPRERERDPPGHARPRWGIWTATGRRPGRGPPGRPADLLLERGRPVEDGRARGFCGLRGERNADRGPRRRRGSRRASRGEPTVRGLERRGGFFSSAVRMHRGPAPPVLLAVREDVDGDGDLDLSTRATRGGGYGAQAPTPYDDAVNGARNVFWHLLVTEGESRPRSFRDETVAIGLASTTTASASRRSSTTRP